MVDRVDFRVHLADWDDLCVVAFSSKVCNGFLEGLAEPAELIAVACGTAVVKSGHSDGPLPLEPALGVFHQGHGTDSVH